MPREPYRVYVNPFTLQEVAICTRCGYELPLEDFYEVHGRHKSGIGYSSWCKHCIKEYRENYRDKRIVVNPKTGREEILCSRCNEQKSVKEFYSQNYRYSKYCKRCFRLSRIAAE